MSHMAVHAPKDQEATYLLFLFKMAAAPKPAAGLDYSKQSQPL